jgi:Domain of unknown function (DUF4328)
MTTEPMRVCVCCERPTPASSLACQWCYRKSDSPPTWLNNPTYETQGWGILAVIAVAVATVVGLGANLFAPLVAAKLTDENALLKALAAYALLQLAVVLFLAIAGALVIVWMWRTAKNLEAFPSRIDDLSAAWAIGGWFIPIGNLFIPYRVMSQIVREELRRGEGLVGLWWGCLVLNAIATIAGRVLGMGTPQPAESQAAAYIQFFEAQAASGYASALLIGGAGTCLCILILAVSRAQGRRLAARAERLKGANVAVPAQAAAPATAPAGTPEAAPAEEPSAA